MLLVQDFLKTHSFLELEDTHNVCVTFNNCYYKWSLNYDQISAKEDNILSNQCRGLILSTIDGADLPIQNNNYKEICPGETLILAYPMNRFFNLNQPGAANINWNDPNLRIQEKLDGTLIILYYDVHKCIWHVATRSVSEANIPLSNNISSNNTFRTLFEKALMNTNGMSFIEFTSKLNTEQTYCFELTSPYNEVIVNYIDTKITFLFTRNNKSFKEIPIYKTNVFGVPCVQEYSNIIDIVSFVNSRNPLEHEGVVVLDSKFNRIKIKNASYVLFNKTKNSLINSDRNCLEVILLEKEDDIIPISIEEVKNNLIKLKEKFILLISYYDRLFLEIKNEADNIKPNDKRTFAMLVNKKVNENKFLWDSPFYRMYDRKCNMKSFIKNNNKNNQFSKSFLDHILYLLENCPPIN